MSVVRNIQIQLDVPSDKHDVIDETFDQFQEAAQYVADTGWNDDPTRITTNKTDLHHATYDDVRDQTDLHADHVTAARNLAADALSSTKDGLFQQGEKASKPTFRGTVVVYGPKAVTYHDEYCTLSTVDGRIRADYVVPDDTTATPFEEYWENDEWNEKQATLHKRDGDYYLHVAMEKPEQDTSTTENGAVLGVDLNVDGYLAVTSTGRFLGNADFLNHKRDEYEERRGALQECGTRSAHLTIKSIGNRFSEWSSDYLHRVSKAVVEEARRHDCVGIALEDLDGIRDRIANASKFQQWAFNELQRYIEYKAEEYGIVVEYVNPAYTSQRCSHGECGHVDEDNRDGDAFECLQCGKSLHADYNAARNIAWRVVQHWHKSGDGRANSQVALKSGRLDMMSGFTPESSLTSP